MRKLPILAMIGVLFCASAACDTVSSILVSSAEGGENSTGLSFALTLTAAEAVAQGSPPPPEAESNPTAAVSEHPPAPTFTRTKIPARTPTLDPDAWESMPVVPETISETTRRLYAEGQAMGNDPHAFSILGDCLSLPTNLFGNYGKAPGSYNLGEFAYLQPVIDWFRDSFTRRSITLGDGFNTAAVLSPLRADPNLCEKNETPLACEYRIHKPSYALISLGTDDSQIPPETYEERMRQFLDYSVEQGVVPILATKADNREGGHAFNRILARLAYEYDVPLWNFWAAVQSLPYKGLANDRGHLTWASPNRLDATYAMQVAVPVRNVTALQTLDFLWRGLTGS